MFNCIKIKLFSICSVLVVLVSCISNRSSAIINTHTASNDTLIVPVQFKTFSDSITTVFVPKDSLFWKKYEANKDSLNLYLEVIASKHSYEEIRPSSTDFSELRLKALRAFIAADKHIDESDIRLRINYIDFIREEGNVKEGLPKYILTLNQKTSIDSLLSSNSKLNYNSSERDGIEVFKTFSVKIVNERTRNGVSEVYVFLINNENERVQHKKTDKHGIVVFDPVQFDGNAIFQAGVINGPFGNEWYELKQNEHGVQEIVLLPDIYKCEERCFGSWGVPSFDFYEPKKVSQIEELPDSIYKEVKKVLEERLGDTFYSKTRFVGGTLVSLGEYHKVLGYVGPNWSPSLYYLGFLTRLDSKTEYRFLVEINDQGKVKNVSSLPLFPSSYKQILSLNEAKEVAQEKVNVQNVIEFDLYYSKKYERLVWDILLSSNKNYKCRIELDAFTGEVVFEKCRNYKS